MKKTHGLRLALTGLILVPVCALNCLVASADETAPDYQPPPDTAGLVIVEILPHPASCPPQDSSPLCGDYVKLFNGADEPVNLAYYRLRTSYGGLNSSSSRNTFSLSGSLDPGQYMLINARDDGSPLSLTDSGGYVWLEDVSGEAVYDPVIEYPDASNVTVTGQAWAFDGTAWQWTDSPNPAGPNVFPPPEIADPMVPVEPGSSLKPCAPDQYRNPATNRCRKLASATTKLVACKPGQYRNPATNRCRSLKSSTTSLKPCKPDQYRNPATNRCRSVLAATSTRKPCKPNQERNPETGRCRKIQPKITPVHDIQTTSSATNRQGYLLAVISVGAAAYIFYEWRQEFSASLEKLKLKLKSPLRQNARNLLK